jgi:hypothetical protein
MMRRTLIILGLILASVNLLDAQKIFVWFDAGLKAQAGPTGLYNQAVVDAADVDYAISSGLSYGAKFGVNFGYNAVTFDVMLNDSKAEFEHQDFVGSTEVRTSTLDLYVLYRNEKNLSYFEIGPKYSFLRDASWRRIADGASSDPTDVTDQYKGGLAGVLGFGVNLVGTDGRFSGKLGLRFEYGITDIVSEEGQLANAPVLVDGLYTDGYKGSHPIFAGVVFELNWGIGYYGVTKCGGRTKFFFL